MSPASRRRTPDCLSNVELDEILSGDLAGDAREGRLRGHLDRCLECSDRLAAFAAVEAPPMSRALHAESSRAPDEQPRTRPRNLPRNLGRFVGGCALVGCAAAGILFAWPKTDLAERTKGNGVALTVFVKRAGTVVDRVDAVQGDGPLSAGDEMRFSLTTLGPGHAVVLGLDAKPTVTVYVPTVRVDAAGGNELPGSIVADETAGAERVVAIFCGSPRDPESLRVQAMAALVRAGGRPEAVTVLDTGCLETSVLFHKASRSR